MDNDRENGWQRREAENALSIARSTLAASQYTAAILQSRICVEYCSRAVIATYGQPSWGHSHARELGRVLDDYGSEIRRRFGADTVRALRQLARDGAEIAPWHTRAVYGYRDTAGDVHPPLEICTAEAAERCLLIAERSLSTAQQFLEAWRAARG